MRARGRVVRWAAKGNHRMIFAVRTALAVLAVNALAIPLSALSAPDPSPTARLSRDELIEWAKRDPIGVARAGRVWFERNVSEYRCTFTKRESVNGVMRPEEEIDVRFRARPYTVLMDWKRNADRAQRVLYVDSPEYVDEQGRKVARIVPAGFIARALVGEVKRPIHGPDAQKASRRTIDEFGFLHLFELLEKYHARAEADGVLEYRFEGEGEIDGRPTLIFVRLLPVSDDNRYPDARLVLHLDQQWLVPVALDSYADADGRVLLGSYRYTDVNLEPKFAAADFSL